MSDTLQEITAEFEDEFAPRDDYVPDSDEKFEYRSRAYLEAKAHVEKLREWKEAQVYALEAKFNARIAAAEADAEHHRSLIEVGLLRMEPDAKGKRTVRVPSATVYTTHRVSIVRPDDHTALSLGARLDVAPITKPDWAAVKKHLTVENVDDTLVVIADTGEEVDGIEIAVTDSVTIKEA